ncbi:hypothetical protein M413DRAFT_79542, partial [Hebeloma cylindrosporum]
VMARVMFFWDYVLTFGMEVALVWKSRWNFMKGLYLFQRYLPFTDPIWSGLYRQSHNVFLVFLCLSIPRSNGGSFEGDRMSEVVLMLRTWAVCNQDQCLTIVLPVLYTLCWASGLVIVVRYVDSITFGVPPYPGFQGCFPTSADRDIVFLWVLLIFWDALLLILMLVPAIQAYRDKDNTSLMKVVYRDGKSLLVFSL